MAELFSQSGQPEDVGTTSPALRGYFIPAIEKKQIVDGFGVVIPFGGGSTSRAYLDYGISAEASGYNTFLSDLNASLFPGMGDNISYNLEGMIGPQGPPGRDGLPGVTTIIYMGGNSNFLTALPDNLDKINDLGTAADKLIYTSAYTTTTSIIWTERQPAGDFNDDWYGVASDSDGSHLIAGANPGRLWTSDDYGVTWTERQPAGAINRNWAGVASDSDGSHLIVGQSTIGRLYTSANYGVTWTERQPAGNVNKNWWGVASDSDGSNLIAGEFNGRLWTSANSGATWTERRPAGDVNGKWMGVASDSDGSNLIAANDQARLWTSDDYGVTWTERQPAGNINGNWWTVASDSDGSHLIVGDDQLRLWTSDDSGATWTERRPAGDVNGAWIRVASDNDGSNLIAGQANGRLWTSDDYGVTWTERQPAGAINRDWYGLASDSDGSHIIVGNDGGRLYTGALTDLYSLATWAETEITSAGRGLLDDTTTAAQQDTLGLGTADVPTFSGVNFLEVSELPDPAVEGEVIRLLSDSRLYYGKTL